MKVLRTAVSGSRVRFQQDGYDLDLTYITPKLIAMSYPATGVERTYRNDINEVAKFLNSRHPNVYRVYNLSERSYDYSKFEGRVSEYGFPDNRPPPLELLVTIINDMMEWTAKSSKHVLVVHSLTDKGRVGIVCSCYLLFAGYYDRVFKLRINREPYEMANFAKREFRKARGGGVSSPSQALYIFYFADMMCKLGDTPQHIPTLLLAKKMKLVKIELNGSELPTRKGRWPLIKVLPALSQHYHPTWIWEQDTFHVDKGCIIFEMNAELQGDILVRCLQNNSGSSTSNTVELFRFSFHTDFFSPASNSLRVERSELDDVAGKFPDSFYVICRFEMLKSGENEALYQPEPSSEHGLEQQQKLQTALSGKTIEFSQPNDAHFVPHDTDSMNSFSTVSVEGSSRYEETPESSAENNGLSVALFVNLFEMCKQMEETQRMCERVLDRLQDMQKWIVEKNDVISRREFGAIRTRFRTFLIKYK